MQSWGIFQTLLSNFFLSLFEKVYHSIFPPTWTQSAENGHDMSFNFFVCSFVRLLIFFVCPFIQFLCLSICSFFVAFYYFLLLFVFSHPSSTTIPFRELMGKLVKRGFLDSSPTDNSKDKLVLVNSRKKTIFLCFNHKAPTRLPLKIFNA